MFSTSRTIGNISPVAAADVVLQADITAETNRATAAEGTLTSNVSTINTKLTGYATTIYTSDIESSGSGVLTIGGGSMTQTIDIGQSSTVQTINIGAGGGGVAKVINLGVAGDTLNVGASTINEAGLTNPLICGITETGDVYGDCRIEVANRNNWNGAKVTIVSNTDLAQLLLTTTATTRTFPACISSENRPAALVSSLNANLGGELQLYTEYGNLASVAAFGDGATMLRGSLTFYNSATTTTAPTAGTIAVSALVTGFLQVNINGYLRNIPYY